MALLKLRDTAMEAYSIARNPENFALLESDLEGIFGKNWDFIDYPAAGDMLGRGNLSGQEILFVCIDAEDESDLDPIMRYVRAAKRAGMQIVLIVRDVSPMSLHALLELGADQFAPYPLPPNALANIHERLLARREQQTAAPARVRNRHGIILPVYGAAGGVGSTTFAVNLAWEMAQHTRKTDMRVALIDLDFQYGSVATLLDLPRRDAVMELLSEPDSIDEDTLTQAMSSFKSALAVMAAPPETVPLDIVQSKDIARILSILQRKFDFIVVDLPRALTEWSGTVLNEAETYFTVLELDMRSAQNVMRYLRLLRSEDLPGEKIQFVLNRAPGSFDLSARGRIGRFSESLGIDIKILMPDGGKAVSSAMDQGLPLADSAPKNALRREISKMAKAIVDQMIEARAAVAD